MLKGSRERWNALVHAESPKGYHCVYLWLQSNYCITAGVCTGCEMLIESYIQVTPIQMWQPVSPFPISLYNEVMRKTIGNRLDNVLHYVFSLYGNAWD